MTGCERFEPFKVSRDMPEQLVIFPYGVVLCNSNYDGDGFHWILDCGLRIADIKTISLDLKPEI